MAEKHYLKATTGFLLPGGRQIRFGDLVATDDEMFRGKGRESLRAHFEPVTQETVEQATRAPGEIRIMTPRRPARKSQGTNKPQETPAQETSTETPAQETSTETPAQETSTETPAEKTPEKE